ncbi:MAG: acylphosphatase [Acidimicrobiia bacterium]
MTTTIRVRVVVTGRVQGVWFRDTCQDVAKAAGVHGYVRNRADTAVEAEFEGPEPAVEHVIAWCRTGPTRARVDGVDVERIATVGDRSFRIR